MSPNTNVTTAAKPPKTLLYLRILVLIEITRFAGLLFLTIPSTTLPAYFTTPFGVGDTLVAITAIILAISLGKGGARVYGLTVAWTIYGLVDGLFGLAISNLAGLFGTISSQLGPALIILPIGLVIHLIVLGLLMTKGLSQYFAKK